MPITNKLGSGVLTTTTPVSNPCSPNPCQNNGFCTQTGTSNYICSCLSGFQGSNCQVVITTTTPVSNPCSPNPCQNNGFCTQTGTSNYICSCLSGFQGSNCQVVITTTTTTPSTTRDPGCSDESPVNCPFFASQGFCQDFYFINGT